MRQVVTVAAHGWMATVPGWLKHSVAQKVRGTLTQTEQGEAVTSALLNEQGGICRLVEAVDPLPPQGSAPVIKAFGLGRTE
jgi:hypothetical protein